MNITPLRTYRPRDHALLSPGHRTLYVETRWGARMYQGSRDIAAALDKLAGFTCYVDGSLQRMIHTTGATDWVLSTWKGRETGITHVPSGLRVTSLRSTLEASADPFSDLTRVLDWLHDYLIAPASISSMAWSLLRASLGADTVVGCDPVIGAAAMYGPRQQGKPGHFRGQVHYDKIAAYPTAMAARPYALSLRAVDPATDLDPAEPGIAAATVHVPHDMPYPPLPVRIAPEVIQFQWGQIEGTWPWVELAAARTLGCDVRVTRCWAPRRVADLFGPWWQLAQQGRTLPGEAAALAKAIANSCWGQFAMQGDQRAEVHWVADNGTEAYEVALSDRVMPHRWARQIAAETTARVRVETLLDGLYGMDHPPIHVDTDGIIVRKSSHVPPNSGTGFGQWRRKSAMPEIEIKAPQVYRWTCAKGCGLDHAKWHYCTSGTGRDAAAELFRTEAHLSTRISYRSREDVVLPEAASYDENRIAALLAEARLMGVR